MSKKVLSSVLIIILALVLGVSLVACNDTEEPPLTKYTITFDSNGGSEVASISGHSGKAISATANGIDAEKYFAKLFSKVTPPMPW
mgnify:CR=1 FL=1|jgi:uncharacterized lipoprotein YehR (DUF1307 family)